MTSLWNAIRGRRRLAIAVGVLVAGLATAAVVVFALGILPYEGPTEAANKTSSSARPTPAGFTPFRSEQAGVELAYPASWTQRPSAEARALLVSAQDEQDVLQVRAFDLPQPVERQQLAAAKQLTDQMVTANKEIQMLAEPKQVELGGVPGFLYLYSYKDPSGQDGLHSHWVLFNGKTAITMVFQALPKERFANSAPIINQIAGTFQVLKK